MKASPQPQFEQKRLLRAASGGRGRSAACSAVAATVFLLGLQGCSGPSELHIEVHAHYPDETALTDLVITALPFDRDALRDSLAEASGIPRPQFPELEAELVAYRKPNISGLEESLAPWQAIRDSVQHLADSLNTTGSNASPQYAAAYARLRNLYQRLARSSVDRDATLQEEVGDDRQLAVRASLAADSLRNWETITFAQFPTFADSVMAMLQGCRWSAQPSGTRPTLECFVDPLLLVYFPHLRPERADKARQFLESLGSI